MLQLLKTIVPSVCRQGDAESKPCFPHSAHVLDQVPFGWWSKLAFCTSIRLFWDLSSGTDPQVSSQCCLHCSLKSEEQASPKGKMGWELSLAIWQSLSGAKQSQGMKILLSQDCCTVAFCFFGGGWQRGRRLLKISLLNSTPHRLEGNSFGGIDYDL